MRKLMMTAVLAFLSLSALTAQERQWAVVNLSSNFLRDEPDYEAGNGTQTLMGTVLEVLDADGIWRKVVSPDPYTAWTNELGLAMMDEAGKDAYIAAHKWICTAEYSYVYTEPDTGSQRLCDFNMGDLVRMTDSPRKVPGWVRVLLPDGRAGWARQDDVMDFNAWAQTRECTAENIISLAKTFNGVPYMWGGNSVKYFDCSGLTKLCFYMNGVLLPRNCSEQVRTGVEVPIDFGQMQPGDLVFFGQKATAKAPLKATHVAIYMGDKRIIQASQMVRMNSLDKDAPDYYSREIIAVRRIIGHVDDGTGAVSVKSSPWYFKQ